MPASESSTWAPYAPPLPQCPPSGPEFERLLETASTFWPRVVPSYDGDRVILVDLKCQDLRVALRTLTYAKGLQRVRPAHLVAVVGLEPLWPQVVWGGHDPEALLRLGRAYGVSAFVDHDVDPDALEVGLPGHPLQVPAQPPADDGSLAEIVDATVARLLLRPRVDDAVRAGADHRRIAERAARIVRTNAGMLASWDVVAYVTSHVDYNDWGLLVSQAVRADVPVCYVLSTGGLKAYNVYGDSPEARRSVRAASTTAVGSAFEERLWPHRDVVRRSAELTAFRGKHNLGRPPWWRGGSESDLHLNSAVDKAVVRRQACRDLGWDPAKPVVGVFNHAISDALGTNLEAFPDLAAWFEATVRHAAGHDEVNWLLVDHPAQRQYDATGMFHQLAEEVSAPHLHFTRSMDLSKNALWSLVDLAVTVRGSVSAEYPAFGIPALQAGWSDWSGCGFTTVAADPDDYWAKLTRHVDALLAGDPLIDDEQVERARLWMWGYRTGADVVSPLLPHWSISTTDELCTGIERAMREVDVDGDPALAAVRRMWLRREPWLTRWDFSDATRFTDGLGPTSEMLPGGRPAGGWLATAFDPPKEPLPVPYRLTTGDTPYLVATDQLNRLPRVVGRLFGPRTTVALRIADRDRPLRLTVTLELDQQTDRTRHRRGARRLRLPPVGARTVEVLCQGTLRGTVHLDPAQAGPRGRVRGHLAFDLPAGSLDPDAGLVLELRDPEPELLTTLGLRLVAVDVQPGPGSS